MATNAKLERNVVRERSVMNLAGDVISAIVVISLLLAVVGSLILF